MANTNILLEAGTNELEIVEFYLDELEGPDEKTYRGYYGVNVAKVLEIIRQPRITELPEVRHKAILGAFNLRSQIIPLVDLTLWLGKEREPSDSTKVIVTEFNSVTTAFMVSGVNRIHRISWEEVEPPNHYVSKLTNNTITGVVKLEGRIIFLLDLERIVGDLNPELALHLDEAVDWQTTNRYRALIADDSAVIREMLKDLMTRAGFDIETVTNGLEAWKRLEAIKRKAAEEGKPLDSYVQCIVSDIEMPQMDGHSLCKRIKEDPFLKQLPVILFSSLITEKLRHKGQTVGADEQISKPEVTRLAQKSIELINRVKKTGVTKAPME